MWPSIEPQRTKDGHITVELRVLGPHDLSVDLVRNLERSRRFLTPRIEGESAENTNNLNQRQQAVSVSNLFEYEISADYNPPTPEERAELKNASLKTVPTGSETPAPAHRQHSRALPALPADGSRKPYTGPAPGAPKPSPATHGGAQ